jgi:chaperone required for assembly of F1-ATPase
MNEPANEPSWDEAIKRAQVQMQAPKVKRFYKQAGVAEAEGGFALTLDDRVARTPARRKLIAPTRALAEGVSAEWAAQGEILDPASMPLTRLAHTALDGVAEALDATIAEVAKFAGADLVCYRATEPESLAARQAAAFDPVLAFAEEELGARFILAGGIMHAPQPPASVEAVREAIPREPFAATALHSLTSLSGSVLIALMIARGATTAEAAWTAAHVDEDFQIERWGADEEAMRRREARWRDFAAAAFALAALRS